VNSTGWLWLLVILILAGAGTLAFFRAEGVAPQARGPETLVVGRSGASVPLSFSDEGSGLRALRVVLAHAGGDIVLLDEEFPGNLASGGVRSDHDVEVLLPADRLEEVQGQAFLRIAVRDWSWRSNETQLDVPLTVDLVAPRIEIATGLSYAKQGGSGAVAYRLSEPTPRHGVEVGEHFFQGFPRPGGGSGDRVALFAIPAESPADARVRVVAEDEAGNRSEARWPLVVKPRALPEANVTLSPGFLERVLPRFASDTRDAGSPAKAFDVVNTRIRAQNEARIREILSERHPSPHFDGALEQLQNSKVTSRFGERRAYFLDGRKVSNAIHYGYDLASTAAAPITAAGAGRVVFANDLGIYGNCVLIDHGLGLSTLYGHLSRLDVQAGDSVERGQRLGLSGDTGLAGGDHLHFSVLVGDSYVDPIEWWDASWVRSHVDVALRPRER
jgi:murein DD-endopeptidase MepM/ murein hydrolase activator NlpD